MGELTASLFPSAVGKLSLRPADEELLHGDAVFSSAGGPGCPGPVESAELTPARHWAVAFSRTRAFGTAVGDIGDVGVVDATALAAMSFGVARDTVCRHSPDEMSHT